VCCNFCTHSWPEGSQQHPNNPSVCVKACSTCSLFHVATGFFLTSQLPRSHRHGGTPKAQHRSAPPCEMSLLLPKGSIPSALRLSTHLVSQLCAPLCALGDCRRAPRVFTPLRTYLSTPACEYLHVADLTYPVLFPSVPLHVFMTLKALPSPAKLLGLHSLQCFSLLGSFKVEGNVHECARLDRGINKARHGHDTCKFPF